MSCVGKGKNTKNGKLQWSSEEGFDQVLDGCGYLSSLTVRSIILSCGYRYCVPAQARNVQILPHTVHLEVMFSNRWKTVSYDS